MPGEIVLLKWQRNQHDDEMGMDGQHDVLHYVQTAKFEAA